MNLFTGEFSLPPFWHCCGKVLLFRPVGIGGGWRGCVVIHLEN